MKKIIISVLFVLMATGLLMAETADHFTFTLASGGGYDAVAEETSACKIFGVDYNFNETFTGGFKYVTIANQEISLINITTNTAKNVFISLYTGSNTATNDMVFGAGVEYDFFTKKDALFSSMGVFVDWFAGDDASFDIEDGGSIAFGLKTKVGI